MSQANIFIEVHVKDEKSRERLVDELSDNAQAIKLKSDVVDLEQVFTDDVISIQGVTGEYTDCEAELREWLKKFMPEVAAIQISDDYDTTSFGLLKSRKTSYKKAIDALIATSIRIETAFKIESLKEKELVQFLKKNDIQATEKFQGITHFDRCFDAQQFLAMEFFIDRGLNPNHKIVYFRSVGKVECPLAPELMEYKEAYPLVKKLIEKGLDINVQDEYGNSLLHLVDENSLSMCQYLVEKGIDVNVTDKEGKTPLMKIICNFFSYNDPEDLEDEPELFEDLKSIVIFLVKRGSNLELYDNNGAGILLYARHYDEFRHWISAKSPELKLHSPVVDYEEALTSLIRERKDTMRFYEACLKENLTRPFYLNEFVKLFKHRSSKTLLEKQNTAILYASELVEMLCRYDRADLFDRLEGLGFPLLMPCYGVNEHLIPPFSSGCSLRYAQHCGSDKIVRYMEERGITEAKLENIESKLSQWLATGNEFKDDMTYIIENTSALWRESIIMSWTKGKKLSDSPKIKKRLDEHIKMKFSRVVEHNSKKHMNHIWGDKVFFGPDSMGFVAEGDTFIIRSNDEIYECVKLKAEVIA